MDACYTVFCNFKGNSLIKIMRFYSMRFNCLDEFFISQQHEIILSALF